MELRLGFFGQNREPVTAPIEEVTAANTKLWDEAYLGKNMLQHDAYITLVSRRNDPSIKAYGSLIVDYPRKIFGKLDAEPPRVHVEIPASDHTPNELLIQKAYETTFFGEVDPDKYRDFATDEFSRDKLFAFLNRDSAGNVLERSSEWFYRNFGISHQEPYGSVFIGSHGWSTAEGYAHFATIESRSMSRRVSESPIHAAVGFARKVEDSIPHIKVEPIPVSKYLDDLQKSLKFLPKDW